MSFSQGHALLIGVGTHQHHPGIDVPITVKDAQAIANVLQDSNSCGYPLEQVKLLYDQQTTKAGILTALDELSSVDKNATVFFFFCGHGALGTDGNYYLVTYDARVEHGRVVANSGVSEGELLAKLRAIPAQRVLMIFNACHAGNISPTLELSGAMLNASNPSADAAAALLATGSGRIIIAACGAEQKSWIGPGPLTIFTQAVVDGLRGQGVRNNGGYISAFSLYEQIYETVSEVAQEQLQAIQEPELTVLKGVGPFAVSLYKGASVLGAFDEQEEPPAHLAVRQITERKSQRALYQIYTKNQSGGVNIAGQARVAVGGDLFGGDKIDARGAQGFVHKPQAAVHQHYGNQIETGGGTYVDGNVATGGGSFTGRDQHNTTTGQNSDHKNAQK